MKLRKRIRRIPEALLVLFARAFIPLLSRRAVLRLARFLGSGGYYLSCSLRRISMANLDLVFGDSKTAAEKQEISRLSFINFSLVLLDLFWFNGRTRERLDQYLKVDESFARLLDERPLLIVTAHYGNWEMIGVGVGGLNLPLIAIARPMKNPFANKALNRIREHTGSEIVPRKGAIRYVIKSLNAGRSTILAVDQNTLPHEGGIFVPFFGMPVPVSKATGTLASRTGAKIAVTWCVPDENGVYTIYAREPLAAEAETSPDEITELVTRELETVIREHPRYWLWSYKRWRFYRASDDAARYPFYAESFEEYSEYRDLVKAYRAAVGAADEAHQAVKRAERITKRKNRRH
jgi:KDO2-lipid IV(A) lauroyltransferase